MQKSRNFPHKTNQELVRKLAQKSYDEKIIRLASRRLVQIKKITRDYEDDELKMVYLKEHKERKKRIHPVEPVWEQQVEEWMKQEYFSAETEFLINMNVLYI